MVDEMIVVFICEQYGWGYEEYLNQPEWFIDLIRRKIEIDGKKQESKNKK